jgi:hypothetical protein
LNLFYQGTLSGSEAEYGKSRIIIVVDRMEGGADERGW